MRRFDRDLPCNSRWRDAVELEPRQRERSEAHMLGCDDCWREVKAGRDGRVLAESLREVAPQHLRERIRAMIAAAPAPRSSLGADARAARGGRRAAGGAGARPTQPAPIAAAVASYRAGLTAWEPTTVPPPARQLGGLTWRGSGRGELAGMPVVAHAYQDVAGHRGDAAV